MGGGWGVGGSREQESMSAKMLGRWTLWEMIQAKMRLLNTCLQGK